MRHGWVIMLLMMLTTSWQAEAQSDPIYRREFGGGIGLTNYLGDFNGNLTKNMQPAVSLIYRRNFSPWQGIRLDMQMTTLKGSTADAKDKLIDYQEGARSYTFKRTMFDLNVVYEYNFWPYGTGDDYRGAKRLVPYIFIGLGGTLATGGGSASAFGLNLPVGLGMKYKITNRLNLGIDWGVHFTTSDNLDGVVDPKYVESSGIFKNTDCYSSLRVSLTYSFSAICPTCNKYE